MKKSYFKPSLPSPAEIAEFLSQARGKVGKRDIAKAFGIKGEDRKLLNQLLREMKEEGSVGRRGKTLHSSTHLPPVLLAEIAGRDEDGDLIAHLVEGNAEPGEKPRILIPARSSKPGLPSPGPGDRVLLRIAKAESETTYSGRIVKIIGKGNTQLLGVFRATPQGGRVLLVDKKARERELTVAQGDIGEAQDGDLVSVSLSGRSSSGLPRARVREKLGSVSSEKAVSLIAIHAHGLPSVFSREALSEAETAKPARLQDREDWRKLALITIDPADARDHDDAVHAAPDPDMPGGFVLTVAIADVASYVRPGSALDRDALERGNSVYFPDRVVPMLPERISNDLCSLRPLEDRPALAVRMQMTAEGQKIRHSFHRILMRSKAKLSYQQAQAAIDGQADDVTEPLLEPVLKPLWAAYEVLARERDRREPLFLDLPERKILLNPEGGVDRVLMPQRLETHRLIEEFMILANVAAAETLEKSKTPFITRAHGEPSLEKMRMLGEVLASIGIKLPKQGALKPALFNRVLKQVENGAHSAFVNEIVLRSQAQAEYTVETLGHFGLNLRRYAHFTSPIRRYADLVVHRALIAGLKLGSDGLPADTTRETLSEVAVRISGAERRAMVAERETVDRLIAQHLSAQIGATFSGRISGVVRAGLFIRLDHTGADGFIPASTLGADYYRYDEARHALIGNRDGKTFRLGDRVEAKLVEAAPVAGALRFSIVSEGQQGNPQTTGRLSKGRARRPDGKPEKSLRKFKSR